MSRPPSVYDLLSAKGTRKWIQLHVDSPAEAEAAAEAGIDIITCEPDHQVEAIRRAAPSVFMFTGIPLGSVSSPTEAVRAGFATLRRGVDAVYCPHSPFFIEAMAREGIPVTGHVGMVPSRATWTNFRAIGRTMTEATKVLGAVRDIENAGAAFVEVEVVPVELADHITRTTTMLTMGMGSGDVCDTQYLFSCDILGTNTGHYPRHSKKYADFVALERSLQEARVRAFREFVGDVRAGAYPQAEHEIRWDAPTQADFTRRQQEAGGTI